MVLQVLGPAAAIDALPVVVTPRPEELLLGLGLRCDLANGFPAGSTGMMLARHNSGPATYGRPGFSVTGNVFDLEAFAQLIGSDHQQIVATTYRAELLRLFGPDVSSKRLGRLGPFRVCPDCIEQDILIRRETILPWVDQCPVHRVALVTRCTCGAVLRPTSSGEEPFTCSSCWAHWGSLPRSTPEPWDDLRQRRIIHAYRVILDRGDDQLPGLIATLSELNGPPRWNTGWSTRPFQLERLALQKGEIRSLASYVAALIIREVPPERLFEPRPLRTRERLSCANRHCLFYRRRGSMRLNGMRANGAETYCSDCGSRYIGDRMILSFDLDNGSSLNPLVVQLARARLELFHELLATVCDRPRDPWARVHIGQLFRDAGIPNARYLRARRLGLVAAARARLGSDVILDADSLAPDVSPRWAVGERAHPTATRLRPGPPPRKVRGTDR